MNYTTSYNQFTTRSTNSSGTSVMTSSGDELSMSSTSVSATTQTSTPDNSDGLAANLGGEAIAVGEDTLTLGSISGALVDDGAVTTLDGSATMVAASDDPDGETAFSDAYTFADVSDGAEFSLVINQETDSLKQSAVGSTSTATSSTSIVAYDLQLDNTTAAAPVLQPPDGETDGDVISEAPQPSATPIGADSDVVLDGNVAEIDFTGLVVGEDTYVSVDAFVLAVEDNLSLTSGAMVLAVG